MKQLNIIIKVLISIIILYLLFYLNIINIETIAIIKNNLILIISTIFIMFCVLFIASYKWWLLISSMNYNVPFKMSYHLYVTGIFYNIFMPGGAGGDIVKGFYLFRYVKSSQRTGALSTIIVDRLIGFHALLLISFFALILKSDITFSDIFLKIFLFLIFTALLMLPVLFFIILKFSKIILTFLGKFKNRIMKQVFELITKLELAFLSYKNKLYICFKCYLISIFNHLLFLGCFLIIADILHNDMISISTIITSSSLSLVTNTIPITPGGIGIGESSFDFLVKKLSNLSDNIAFGSIFFITYRVLFSIVSIAGVYSFIIIKKPDILYERT